jgi:hypothetical protein
MDTDDPDNPGSNNPVYGLDMSGSSSSMSTSSSMDSETEDIARSRRQHYILTIISNVTAAVVEFTSGLYNKEAYHTSALSGHGWVLELLTGHPDRIRCELGVRHHVFDRLLSNLRTLGYKDSREVTLEEQLAIFLYTCVTGLSIRHVGERFQRANNTISK